MSLKIVLLIGGKGTRMSPMTNYWPKEMFPMINKPFLSIIFDKLKALGINDSDVCLVSSKDKIQIQEQFPQYTYIYDNNSGFSNAILFSKQFVKDNDFMLILGDMFLADSDLYEQMINKYNETKKSVLGVFSAGNDFNKYCEVFADQDIITKLIEKPTVDETGLSTTGQYIFTNEFYELLEKYKNEKNAFGFTKAMNDLDTKYMAYSTGFMLDVGNIDNYVKSINYIYEKGDF